MNRKRLLIIIIFISLIGIIITIGFLKQRERKTAESIVQIFGERLKNVSLFAPTEILNQSIRENYSDLVSIDLMNKWTIDPESAPGRLTSSPWPDYIEILKTKRLLSESYEISGNIIEITSVEMERGGIAAKQPITLTVSKTDGKWLISAAVLGEYDDTASWKTFIDQTTGVEFRYPEELPTLFIHTQVWPPKMTVENNVFSCAETPAESSLAERVMEKTIVSRVYCIKAISEGAAGSVYTDYTYRTADNGKIISLSFILRYPQCDNYSEDPDKTNCANERSYFDLDGIVSRIIASAKFD